MVEEALRRGWENLIGRSDGLMNFRLLIQPAVAIFFAIRAGLRDARKGQPPFLWEVFSNRGQRHELLRQGWKDVGSVFVVALILDSIYQVMVHSGIYTLELLLTASILALVPYATMRGLVTRLAPQQSNRATTDGPSGRPETGSEDQQQKRKDD